MRHSKLIHYAGRSLTMREWAKELGLPYTTIASRVRHGAVIDAVVKCGPKPLDTLPWSADLKAQQLVAERGAMTLEEIGEHMGFNRENARRLVMEACRSYAASASAMGLLDEQRAMMVELGGQEDGAWDAM